METDSETRFAETYNIFYYPAPVADSVTCWISEWHWEGELVRIPPPPILTGFRGFPSVIQAKFRDGTFVMALADKFPIPTPSRPELQMPEGQ